MAPIAWFLRRRTSPRPAEPGGPWAPAKPSPTGGTALVHIVHQSTTLLWQSRVFSAEWDGFVLRNCPK